jgi:hypothetical protein
MHRNSLTGSRSTANRHAQLAASIASTEIPPQAPLNETISATLSDWWRKLSPWGKAKKGNCFSPNEMATISNEFPCPDNEHTIRSYCQLAARINGSKIKLGERIYKIGQSPLLRAGTAHSPAVENYSNAISYGLESGQGLVQIVSDRTHQRRDEFNRESRQTLVGMLQAKLEENRILFPSGVQIKGIGCESFGGFDYRLTKIEEVKQPGGLQDPNFRQYILTLRLPRSNDKITMPLTQIGMPFENATLKASDIERASEIASTNHERLRKFCYGRSGHPLELPESMVPNNEGPMILSKFGHGRSATIVTYQAVCKMIHDEKIKSEKQVLKALMEVIETGRAARPHFVHSRAQVEQLQIALVGELKKLQNRQKQALEDRYSKPLGYNEKNFIYGEIAKGVWDFRRAKTDE